MRAVRYLACFLVVTLLGAAFAPPASAAPPGNDTYATATPVTIGFSEVVDVSEATSDTDDDEIAATCGESFPPPEEFAKSIWYSFSTDTAGTVSVDTTSEESFPAAIVATGTPGSFEGIACGGGEVAWQAEPGQTYVVAVIDFDPTGAPLSVKFQEAVPFALDVTVDPRGGFYIDGEAQIRGTYTCNSPLQSLQLNVLVRQQVGGKELAGFHTHSIQEPVCDEAAHPWSTVVAATGDFRGGKATVQVDVNECSPQNCNEDPVGLFTVQLSRIGTGAPTPPTLEEEPDPIAPPVSIPMTNDTPATAYALTANQPVIVDTTGATTGPEDAAHEATCLYGFEQPEPPLPHLDNSVWFTFTAPKSGPWYVNAIGSDYVPLLASRTPLFNLTICGALHGPIFAPKGQQVTIMVTDYFGDEGGLGGELKLVVQDHPVQTFGTTMTIDPVATFDKDGVATVTGTWSCFEPVPDAVTEIWFQVQLVQDTGRFTEGIAQNALLTDDATCDGVERPWSGEVDGTQFGVGFQGGKAKARVIVETHAPPAPTENEDYEAFVQLHGAP